MKKFSKEEWIDIALLFNGVPASILAGRIISGAHYDIFVYVVFFMLVLAIGAILKADYLHISDQDTVEEAQEKEKDTLEANRKSLMEEFKNVD